MYESSRTPDRTIGSAPVYLTAQAASARLYESAGHNHNASRDLDPAKLAPLTAMAQEYIWKHQHPQDCTAVRFGVSNGHWKGNGIGSIMHVSGYHLAAAIHNGLVFMWAPTTGEEWTDPVTCPEGARNFECHFRPPTHCGREFLRGADGDGERNFVMLDHPHSPLLGFNRTNVPAELECALMAAAPEMTDFERKFWWRAQSVAYLMRMNDATVAAVRALRTDPALFAVRPEGGKALTTSQAASIPFPRGTLHAHVRHGDKYTEMQLQGTERYLDAAYSLVHHHPLSLRRVLFISTEDEKVLTEAEAAIPHGWVIIHNRIRRSNTGPFAQVQDLGANNAAYTTRTHLLQLLMTLEADAEIGTLGSNWNRLLHELRCVWVPKCVQPYVDVGTPESWAEYDW